MFNPNQVSLIWIELTEMSPKATFAEVEIRQLLDFTKVLAVFIAEWCNTKKEE